VARVRILLVNNAFNSVGVTILVHCCIHWSLIFQETVMEWVIAMIQPHQFDKVLLALKAAEFQGVTVSDSLGFGRQKGRKEIYRGAEYL